VTVTGAVAVKSLVGVRVLEYVSVYVFVNVAGLWNVPAVLVRVSVQVSVAVMEVRPRRGGETRLDMTFDVDETDEEDEADCLFVGEDDRDVYPRLVRPRLVPYPAVLLIIGVDWLAGGRKGLGERGPAGADAIREWPAVSALLSSKKAMSSPARRP
jgi:hypothetical protein